MMSNSTEGNSDAADSRPQGGPVMAPEISGSQIGSAIMGGQYGQYIERQVNNTYNPVGDSGNPQTPGQFQVSCRITVLEKDPISLSSRIFKGLYHSDVTGDRPAAIKIIAADEKNYREAKIYFSVPHHKNIVERFATDAFNLRGQPSIFIAMEHCDCNLYEHVTSEVRDGIPFDEEKYSWIAYQILVALEYLHSFNVVHGDFKPANVLLILNGFVVKITDFGLSRAVTLGKTSTQLTFPQGGTTGWQAPEVLKGSDRISIRSDVFPCGLTLFFTWSHGKHPFGNEAVSQNYYILKGRKRDLSGMLVSFAPEAEMLLEKALQRNPRDRPTIRDLLQSPIFDEHRPQAPRVDDSFLVEFFDRALRPGEPRQPKKYESKISDDNTIIGVTASQLETTLKTFIEKNLLTSSSTKAEPGRISSNLSPAKARQYLTKPEFQQAKQKSEGGSLKYVLGQRNTGILPREERSTTSFFEHHIETVGANGAPMCRNGCNIIFLSPIQGEYLPQLTSQIYRDSAYNGKGEFVMCNRTSNPKMIQERISDIPTCADGITTILIAFSIADIPLSKALNDNSLRRFLQQKGLSGDVLEQKMRNIANSLAVFVFCPWNNIPNDVAEIVVNFHLSEKGDGKLRTFRLSEDVVADIVIFQTLENRPAIGNYLDNEEVMSYIRRSLRRENGIERCHSHL